MDVALTRTSARTPLLNLTAAPTQQTNGLAAHAAEAAASREEPPAKRRRVDGRGGDGSPRTRDFKSCLHAQVFPHITDAIAKLPPDEYDRGSISFKSLNAVLDKFRSTFSSTTGFLSAEEERAIAEEVGLQVRRIALQTEEQPSSKPTDSQEPTPTIERPLENAPGELKPRKRLQESPPSFPDIPLQQQSAEAATLEKTIPSSDVPHQLEQLAGVVKQQPTALPISSLWPTEGATDHGQKAVPNSTPSNYPPSVTPSFFSTKLFERRPVTKRRQPQKPKTGPIAALGPNSSSWFQSKQRPYLTAADRDLVAKGVRHPISISGTVPESAVYHADFTADEVAQMATCLQKYVSHDVPATLEALTLLCYQVPVSLLVELPARCEESVRNFCSDLLAGKASPLGKSRVLSLGQDTGERRERSRQSSRVSSLLFARELEGNVGFGRTRRLENFENEFRKAHEDELTLVAEYTNCAGDIFGISWVSGGNFICGTTTHSDTHNQQYNKPGNLLLCSTTQGTLRAFPDHRIPRPWVEKGDNSTEAMRRSQDPWLYTSVVSSDYDKAHGWAYTSSFDKTVKAWEVNETGRNMTALGTWEHGGNVNFVVAAKDGSGRVATASDVPSEAVRIYSVNGDNIADSAYQTFSCSRLDAEGSDKWAYYPATMQWGRAPGTHHLLLVGYSPRSLSGDDRDIPEDKRRSGEITLWDAARGCRVPVMTASTTNVFEVVWHPTLMRFAAATTPSGNNVEYGARTQIHLFQRDHDRGDGGYSEFQSLDCRASDINELTFAPNSLRHAYVTAACTDGRVYVWDTAQGDHPLHVLKHGDPLDDFSGDREREDTGVKFTAWGSSPDRFYTGGSDGVVKAWNVRKGRKPLERVLLRAPGPISCGAFSPDHSKLAVGDATGRVFLLSLDKRDERESHFMTLPGSGRRVRRPNPFIPHPEPPEPDRDASRGYLDAQQLVLSRNPVVGAVQGPLYAATGLFRRDAHLDDDPAAPLLPQYDRLQRHSVEASRGLRRRSMRRIREPGGLASDRLAGAHSKNRTLDLDLGALEEEVVEELVRAGAMLSLEGEEGWELRESEHFEDL